MPDQDSLALLGDRLQQMDLATLSDDQVIQLAQAQAALAQAQAARIQSEVNQTLGQGISTLLSRLLYNLDCTYRHKWGKFPEAENWQ